MAFWEKAGPVFRSHTVCSGYSQIPRKLKQFFLSYTSKCQSYTLILRPNCFLQEVCQQVHCDCKTIVRPSEKRYQVCLTRGHEQTFQKLKEALINSPVLAFPEFNIPFKLFTDGSYLGISAILTHLQNGLERVVTYTGRALMFTRQIIQLQKLKHCP